MDATSNLTPSEQAVEARIADGSIIEQKCWQFIRELNSVSEEKLNAVALTQGDREFTYRQMFRMWERYAEAFTALNITEQNQSRVVLISAQDSKATFVIYALNMLGVPVSIAHFMDVLDEEAWERLVEKEGITDAVLCSQWIQPKVLQRVMDTKEKTGLRNVIVYETPIGDPFAPEGFDLLNSVNYMRLKRCDGALFMDELLNKYDATPIAYGNGNNLDDAVIIHSSGTTGGIHKPIPLSDRGLNEAVARLLRHERFSMLRGKTVSILALDLSYSYGLVDMMHLPLCFGGKIVTIPLGDFNPRFTQAITEYGVTIYFGNPWTVDKMRLVVPKPDLSSLSFVFVGGSYYSAEAKKRYDEFFQSCGAQVRTCNGYGISEAGAACILADAEREDDAIGRPLPGVKVKLYDEDTNTYYNIEDGQRTGVLFLSTPSVSCGRIGDHEFFSLTEIDGEKYLNTFDMVSVNEDGTLAYAGRMNKYFVNNEGIRFNAGLVETAVSGQVGIEACALAPMYDKILHDSFPVLYVQTAGDPVQRINTVRQALYNVFVRDGKIVDSNLPGQCVIMDDIPFTASGKVDGQRLLRENNNGTRYVVNAVRVQGQLTDIRLDLADLNMISLTGIPDEIEGKFQKMLNAMYPVNGKGSKDQKSGRKKKSKKNPFMKTGKGTEFMEKIFPQMGMDWKEIVKELMEELWKQMPLKQQGEGEPGKTLSLQDLIRMGAEFIEYVLPVSMQLPFSLSSIADIPQFPGIPFAPAKQDKEGENAQGTNLPSPFPCYAQAKEGKDGKPALKWPAMAYPFLVPPKSKDAAPQWKVLVVPFPIPQMQQQANAAQQWPFPFPQMQQQANAAQQWPFPFPQMQQQANAAQQWPFPFPQMQQQGNAAQQWPFPFPQMQQQTNSAQQWPSIEIPVVFIADLEDCVKAESDQYPTYTMPSAVLPQPKKDENGNVTLWPEFKLPQMKDTEDGKVFELPVFDLPFELPTKEEMEKNWPLPDFGFPKPTLKEGEDGKVWEIPAMGMFPQEDAFKLPHLKDGENGKVWEVPAFDIPTPQMKEGKDGKVLQVPTLETLIPSFLSAMQGGNNGVVLDVHSFMELLAQLIDTFSHNPAYEN